MDKEYEHDEHGCDSEDCPCNERGYDAGLEAGRAEYDKEAEVQEELDKLRARVLEYLGPAAADESLEIHRFRMDVTE